MTYFEALPDFVKLAEAYGHVGMQIEKPGDVEGALRCLLYTSRPATSAPLLNGSRFIFPSL